MTRNLHGANPRVYLLSPASAAGKRAGYLLDDASTLDLSRRLRSRAGVPLGEVFSFASPLYFRGKLAYARAHASPSRGFAGVLVITPNRGLLPADTAVRAEDLRAMQSVRVDPAEPRYLRPLLEDARALASRLGPAGTAVLLGSIASGKYTEPLLPVLGSRLLVPKEFVGRGDMSRGGLMLRCVAEGRRLTYLRLAFVDRHGPRPPHLASGS